VEVEVGEVGEDDPMSSASAKNYRHHLRLGSMHSGGLTSQ
jgi:hypothetical protein